MKELKLLYGSETEPEFDILYYLKTMFLANVIIVALIAFCNAFCVKGDTRKTYTFKTHRLQYYALILIFIFTKKNREYVSFKLFLFFFYFERNIVWIFLCKVFTRFMFLEFKELKNLVQECVVPEKDEGLMTMSLILSLFLIPLIVAYFV